jgi:hypothetical protein
MTERRKETSLKTPLVWEDFSERGIDTLKLKLRVYFPEFEILEAKSVRTEDEWLRRLESGEIAAKLGYKKGKIFIPATPTLPFMCDHYRIRIATGTVTIDQLTVKTVSVLTEDDATSMGFKNLQDMRFAIWRNFREVWSGEPVTIMRVADFTVHWENGSD